MQEMENSVAVRKKDLEGLLPERIRDPGRAEIYTKMIACCEGDIADLQTKIEDFKNLDETVHQRKKEMKKSMDLLDPIVADGAVSDVNLRMLVDAKEHKADSFSFGQEKPANQLSSTSVNTDSPDQ